MILMNIITFTHGHVEVTWRQYICHQPAHANMRVDSVSLPCSETVISLIASRMHVVSIREGVVIMIAQVHD